LVSYVKGTKVNVPALLKNRKNPVFFAKQLLFSPFAVRQCLALLVLVFVLKVPRYNTFFYQKTGKTLFFNPSPF
jgi:hypothetical protein